jgi:hypothetical protein
MVDGGEGNNDGMTTCKDDDDNEKITNGDRAVEGGLQGRLQEDVAPLSTLLAVAAAMQQCCGRKLK